jgi:MATE family multidrug resistance protein
MLRLAAPLAMAELGWMAMGVVDTIMAGRLGAAAIGAGSLGNMLFYPIAICGTGMLLGMDTLVAQSFGAGTMPPAAAPWSRASGSPPASPPRWRWLALGHSAAARRRHQPARHGIARPLPQRPALGRAAAALLHRLPPLPAGDEHRQAHHLRRVSANLVNFAGNWLFMYGNWGAPRLGLEGSGWSTTISRVYIALGAAGGPSRGTSASLRHQVGQPAVPHVVEAPFRAPSAACSPWAFPPPCRSCGRRRLRRDRRDGRPLRRSLARRPRHRRQRHLHHLHGPARHQFGRRRPRGPGRRPQGPARHRRLRLDRAAARRRIHGRRRPGARHRPRWIARLYTPEAAVIAASAALLRIAALFEIFDGLQVVATGALRGLGDTRTPCWRTWPATGSDRHADQPTSSASLLSWGVTGIWVGLTSALILIGDGAFRRSLPPAGKPPGTGARPRRSAGAVAPILARWALSCRLPR